MLQLGSGGTKKPCLGSDSLILSVYEVVFSPKAFPQTSQAATLQPVALFRLNLPALTSLSQLYSAQMQPTVQSEDCHRVSLFNRQELKAVSGLSAHTKQQRGELGDCSPADGCWSFRDLHDPPGWLWVETFPCLPQR